MNVSACAVVAVDMHERQIERLDELNNLFSVQINIVKFDHQPGHRILVGNQLIEDAILPSFDVNLEKEVPLSVSIDQLIQIDAAHFLWADHPLMMGRIFAVEETAVVQK